VAPLAYASLVWTVATATGSNLGPGGEDTSGMLRQMSQRINLVFAAPACNHLIG